ncbi:mannose-1-phosphate guanyltransferase alpha-like [Ctenocephalides felis]|uniref:mannose-1-phosphate guanyltransferase alpha-like n=1 Tax=Ctenocephalides felis TaxID=7515 RepID=UPI000E6E4C9E|nr:mannose-1-phosphate guanyltransferase alpha-like [Ctenocephalides felis]
MQHEYQIKIRYLQEFTALGTAGGMYHFRDFIRGGSPEAFFILNGDVCADFPLQKLLEFHKKQNNALATIMGTEATKEQAINYGCLVMDKFGKVFELNDRLNKNASGSQRTVEQSRTRNDGIPSNPNVLEFFKLAIATCTQLESIFSISTITLLL